MTDFFKCRLNPSRVDYPKQLERIALEESARDEKRQRKLKEKLQLDAQQEAVANRTTG